MIGQVLWEQNGIAVAATMGADGSFAVAGLGSAGGQTIAAYLAEEYAAAAFGPADGDPRAAFLNQVARDFGGSVTVTLPADPDATDRVY